MRLSTALTALALLFAIAGFAPARANDFIPVAQGVDPTVKACIDACFAFASGPSAELKRCVLQCTNKRNASYMMGVVYRGESSKKKSPEKSRGREHSQGPHDGGEGSIPGRCETYEAGCDRNGGGPDDVNENSHGSYESYQSDDDGMGKFGSGF